MNLLSRFIPVIELLRIELTHLTEPELNELFNLIEVEVLHAIPGSPEWLNGKLALDKMRFELRNRREAALRRPQPRPRGPGF